MLYGIDVSHYQGAFNFAQAKREGFSFAALKATEGATMVDATFVSNLTKARQEFGARRVIAYHFLRPGSASSQASLIKRVVPRDCAVAIDVEAGDYGTAAAIASNLKASGYRVGIYTGHYYWAAHGTPSLTWAAFLWSARYPDMTPGYASVELAHTPASYWNGYGGFAKADILQFTPVGKVAGQQVDCDAFNGSVSELEELFYGKPAATPTKETITLSDTLTLTEIAKALWGYEITNLAHDPTIESPAWQLLQYAHQHAADADAKATETDAKVDALKAELDEIKAKLA